MARWAGRWIGALGLGLLLTAGSASAAPGDEVGAVAPENLRCVLAPAPPPPGPGWQVVPVWQWQVLLSLGEPDGSSDGPYAVALDRNCGTYVTDSLNFQVVHRRPDGTVDHWPLPSGGGTSSSPRGIAV